MVGLTKEISRRLGECSRVIDKLAQIWAHAAFSTRRPIEIYTACVASKLLYSLESLWLLQADRARLDAFHCRCLRRMLGIPHSYYSRVTNQEVLRQAQEKPLSETLLQRQAALYKRIAQLNNDSYVKQLVCDCNGVPIVWTARRSRGRPRQRWALQLYKVSSLSV